MSALFIPTVIFLRIERCDSYIFLSTKMPILRILSGIFYFWTDGYFKHIHN